MSTVNSSVQVPKETFWKLYIIKHVDIDFILFQSMTLLVEAYCGAFLWKFSRSSRSIFFFFIPMALRKGRLAAEYDKPRLIVLA